MPSGVRISKGRNWGNDAKALSEQRAAIRGPTPGTQMNLYIDSPTAKAGQAKRGEAAVGESLELGPGSKCTVRPGSLISTDLGQPCKSGFVAPVASHGFEDSASHVLEDLGLGPLRPNSEEALADLSMVLGANYPEVQGFPRPELTRELYRIVHNFIAPYGAIWNSWQDRQNLSHLRRVFNWGEVIVDAQPYVRDAGLSLWGFSTTTKVLGQPKRLIFLNTAHEAGAVAATIGHELGHYIFASIGGIASGEAYMESMFVRHLQSEEELFCDAVVAMSVYSRRSIADLKRRHEAFASSGANVRTQVSEALEIVDSKYRIDLKSPQLKSPWPIRYCTLMVHLFRLRCALFESAGV